MADQKLLLEEKLIDLVRERPHLYSKQHKDYKNKMVKANAWVSIGEKIGKSGELLIRISYTESKILNKGLIMVLVMSKI
jgi:Alcohol dehydrogenase transcription factor Myb/SANT-like